MERTDHIHPIIIRGYNTQKQQLIGGKWESKFFFEEIREQRRCGKMDEMLEGLLRYQAFFCLDCSLQFHICLKPRQEKRKD